MSGLRTKEFIDLFDKDKKDGAHVIYDRNYMILDDSTNMYKCAKRWIKLSPSDIYSNTSYRKDCLLKAYVYDLEDAEYTETERQILKANNYILPEIARAFGIESASYGRFKILDDYNGELNRNENIAYFKGGNIPVYRIKSGQEYILTPSFLKNDEELMPFGHMGDDKLQDVSIIWKRVEETLISRNIPKDKIKNIRKQYALKSIFGAFVELNDNHNYNDGIIFSTDPSDRTARLAPAFDLDNAMRVYNFGVFGPRYFVKRASDGGIEVKSMLKEFEHDLSEKDLMKLMQALNPESVLRLIKKADERHSLKLTTDIIHHYTKIFEDKYKEMEEFYKERYGKEIDD